MGGNLIYEKSRTGRDFYFRDKGNGEWQDKDAGCMKMFVSHDDVILFAGKWEEN